jgi:hypothetical protein
MKWLTAGLTFLNFATIGGLVIGMAAGGLSTPVAIAAILLATALAVIAYLRTIDPDANGDSAEGGESPRSKYRKLSVWILCALFAIFAFRSFLWVLYWDGTEMKIQSPVNLGDLGLHVTHINFFANGVHLWPSNPIYVGSEHLRYPAGIDLFNAVLLKANLDLIKGLDRDLLRFLSLGRRVRHCRISFQRWPRRLPVPPQFQVHRLPGRQQHCLEEYSADDVRDSARIALRASSGAAFTLAMAGKILPAT